MPSRTKQSGHTLVQVIICVAVLLIVAAVAFPNLSGRGRKQGLLDSVAPRVISRRAEAKRLAPLGAPTSQENYTQPPLAIDFTNLGRTSPLRIEGGDANNDFRDDATGLPLTRFNTNTKTWSYAFEGSPLTMPDGWRVASSAEGLPPGVSLISADGRTLGIPVAAVGFDSAGDAWGDRNGDGVPESPPSSLSSAAPPNAEAPFWALYFTDGETACAVAVHATGLVEAWSYSGGSWKGRAGRAPGN
jgi:type II secretory pathway pseudopilin PulG